MKYFEEYLMTLSDSLQSSRLREIFRMIEGTYPHLEGRIAWNQPMYTDHGTFIIGFSTATHHISVGLEKEEMETFRNRVEEAGYTHGKMLWRIGNDQDVNYELLKQIISYTIEHKRNCTTFWHR